MTTMTNAKVLQAALIGRARNPTILNRGAWCQDTFLYAKFLTKNCTHLSVAWSTVNGSFAKKFTSGSCPGSVVMIHCQCTSYQGWLTSSWQVTPRCLCEYRSFVNDIMQRPTLILPCFTPFQLPITGSFVSSQPSKQVH